MGKDSETQEVVLYDNGIQEITTTRIRNGKKQVYWSASTASWRKQISGNLLEDEKNKENE